MNKIEMNVAGVLVQMSTKSITIDGKEYFYSKMSNIMHSSSRHVYVFTYNGEKVYLPYDVKYASALETIFKQVIALGKKHKAAASTNKSPAATKEATPEPQKPEVTSQPETNVHAEIDSDYAQVQAEALIAEKLALAEANAMEAPAANLNVARDEALAAEEMALAEACATENIIASDESIAVANSESEDASSQENSVDKKDNKKGRLKKGIIVFAAILVIIAALSAAYFILFGTSDSPTVGPNSNQTENYDNIDQMIEELDKQSE